ncbi:hypothetical protein V6N13_027157 [Hibiscus sabdariffa]
MAFSDHSELLVSYNNSSICLFTRYMGLGHDPVPSSSFSKRSEASEKVISQLYNGSAGFESAKDEDSVNFIDSHPQTGVLVSSGTDDFKFWTPNAIDKVVLPTQDELDRHYGLL